MFLFHLLFPLLNNWPRDHLRSIIATSYNTINILSFPSWSKATSTLFQKNFNFFPWTTVLTGGLAHFLSKSKVFLLFKKIFVLTLNEAKRVRMFSLPVLYSSFFKRSFLFLFHSFLLEVYLQSKAEISSL